MVIACEKQLLYVQALAQKGSEIMLFNTLSMKNVDLFVMSPSFYGDNPYP